MTKTLAGHIHLAIYHVGQDPHGIRARWHPAPKPRKHLPPAVDLRTLVRAEDWPVLEQGNLNTCTAHALCAALHFLFLRAGISPAFVPSRLFLWWRERDIEHKTATPCEVFMHDGVAALGDRGICPEAPVGAIDASECWPYDATKWGVKPPPAAFRCAKRYDGIRGRRVRQDLRAMKARLAEGHPFTVTLQLTDGYVESYKTGDIPSPVKGSPDMGGHALLVVGYDDARSVFLVRNSHGTKFGVCGYGTVGYDYMTDPDWAGSFWTLHAAATLPAPSA